jgi:hypothetical protein
MLEGNVWITNQVDCGIAFQLTLQYVFGLTTLPENTYPDFDGVPGIAAHILRISTVMNMPQNRQLSGFHK